MDQAPELIGPYRIVREVGRGGMGVVYLARDSRLDRDVAVKALPAELASDPGRLERFEREARTLASLSHPNIGAIYGVEEQGGTRYLILEYVEGETLADRLDRGPLPVDEAVEVAVEIARGLEAAHEAGVIHRDLKPANIKRTPEGQVKVLDFGLAKTDDGASSTGSGLSRSPTLTSPVPQNSPTIPGAILGTAAYMSPEQARGRKVDKRTDIWAFGVILYEMLTGASPFVGETATDSIGAVLHKSIDPARLPARTPAPVRRVLERCIERDLSLRYRDIGDVRVELLRAGQEPVPQIEPTSRRSVGIAVSAGLVLIALVVGGALAWLLRPAPVQTVLKADLLVGIGDEPQQDLQAQISPDGRRIAYVAEKLIYVRDFDSFEARALAGTEGVDALFWSPDSRWIGYLRGSAVCKIGLVGGGSITLCEGDEQLGAIGAGGWTADGRIIYRADVGLMSVPAMGGKPTLWLAADKGSDDKEGTEIDFHEPRVIPGTNTAIFVSHLASFVDTRLEAYDGQTRVVITGPTDQLLATPTYSPTGHILYSQGNFERTLWSIGFDPEAMRVTSEPFQVLQNARLPSVSSDGTLAVVRGGAPSRGGSLAWIEPGSETAVPLGVGGDLDIRFVGRVSPDGQKIAFTAGEPLRLDIWIADLERKSVSRLTFMETFLSPVTWSPDGREVVFVSFDRTASKERIHTHFLAADGTGPTREPIVGFISSFDRDWNTALLVRNPVSDGRILERFWLDGSRDPEPVPANAELNTPGPPMAVISPDGDLVLLCAGSSGRFDLFCERIDGGRGRYQVSTGGGVDPAEPAVWSADGTRVYYLTEDSKLMQVSVERKPGPGGTPTVQFGIPELALNMKGFGLRADGGWALAPDGQRFLAVLEPESGRAEPVRLSVISNWFGEFRGR